MKEKLWNFTDNSGSFELPGADKIRALYFPLCNDSIMSSVTPDLHGDIKTGQNSFLLTPESRIDLINSKSSRSFWVYSDEKTVWPITKEGQVNLSAGLLWQNVITENKKIGLKAEILSFVPSSGEPVEIMQGSFTNISSRKIKFTPIAAIPIYGRGADNIRDHRHVTSLLQRINLHKYGVVVKPTLSFDESGHKPNKINYFVLGISEKGSAPEYIYPTQEMFCGEGGDLEAPESILKNLLPTSAGIQGKEAMGALRFKQAVLPPGKSAYFTVLLGITKDEGQVNSIINKFNNSNKVKAALEDTKRHWQEFAEKNQVSTGNPDFDNWFRWVSIQPVLRKIFGCSFLPDFDYGKGGRGWRDLWQDCLSLILNDPHHVRGLLINNFSGVRIDGSNATIIGKGPGEFISDRNNIGRVWMDHGVWPLITLNLYMNETADFDILFEEAPYFRDYLINRARGIDFKWDKDSGQNLKTVYGKVYKGTILEHLLAQNLVQFFNVGIHNIIRLEGADWNDGLDMAKENGESVAFSAMYAYNLLLLSGLLLKIGNRKIEISREMSVLLGKVNYNEVKAKISVLNKYFSLTKFAVSGKKITLDAQNLAENLKQKADWLMRHIQKREWLQCGFFNGYYDNQKKRVEGVRGNITKMMLASQVFPIMSGAADKKQIEAILKSVDSYLRDKKFKGVHLNTDFKQEQPDLGRAFSFVCGDKENGAFFSHMTVMYAYALYSRGYVLEGWQALSSIYDMASDSKAKIYPCLPEYFNAEGRGMYSYLTGSASWFVLTMLTQVFGVRAENGNLVIEPKLTAQQFKDSAVISIDKVFAGRKLQVRFFNAKKREYGKYRIIKANLNSHPLLASAAGQLTIPRQTILKLPKGRLNILNIVLG